MIARDQTTVSTTLDSSTRQQVLTCLEMLGLDTAVRRTALLSTLPPALAKHIPRDETPAIDLANMVGACADWVSPPGSASAHPLGLLLLIGCYGPEASAANQALVAGQLVGLEKDVSETDRYGRLLRYVYVGEQMVNAELLRQGYAQVATYPPDVRYAEWFLSLQQEARAAGRGLWGPVCQTPPTMPPPTHPPPTLPPVGKQVGGREL